ncbi:MULTISPECIES: helix-turn-helix transcriptional regulator [Stutzerimonas stutzeri subgroup]|uniref:helix-turn-helix transcriptional regulator n=1 Tax=Stutzerimonas stutzeri subgroup TaxID=578833 RepID=UPI000B200BDD|nr:helix-turn-helix domain-containing protein [Stutzerimonas kunmingensis]
MSSPHHPAANPLPFSPSDLLTADQVAAALGLSHRTLAAWRSTRRGGPAWVKCGSAVRYRRQDVAAWLESQTRAGKQA